MCQQFNSENTGVKSDFLISSNLIEGLLVLITDCDSKRPSAYELTLEE